MENVKSKVLAIILARGGSKSIPKKSIALCAGKPLMFYTIKAAQNAKLIDRIIITTDDEEMAGYARSEGVEVPFMRPKELAEDLTPDLPVMQHALRWLEENEGYIPEMLVHLRPTTPLKASADIDKGIELMRAHPEAESVRSICSPLHTPFKMFRLDEGEVYLKPILSKEYPEVFEKYPEPYNMPRQILPKIWRHSGYVDIIRPEVITVKNSMSGSKILPLPFEQWRDIDIDSQKEIKQAEGIIENLRKDGKEPWQS
jgi:N-acylneuraminate cytidylyltransferase